MQPRVCASWLLGVALLPCALQAQLGTEAAQNRARRVAAGIAATTTERVGSDRMRISITPAKDIGTEHVLRDATGRDIDAVAAPDGSLQAVIEPQKWYVLTPKVTERRPLPPDGTDFPARYVIVTPDGTPRLGGLFLRAARVPLTWNDARQAYVTDLFVGYEFVDGAERDLQPPRTVTFFAEGANARIQADTVRIERSGGAGFRRVTLTTSQRDGETHFTARVGPNDELKSSVSVHREPGALKLSLPSTEIPAFGVGQTDLTVTLLARDGDPLTAAEPLTIQLSSARMRPPPSVVLPAGRSSIDVQVRSAGYGPDAIVARSGPLEAMQPLQLVFPVASLTAAILGGAAGGGARYLRNRRRVPTLLGRRMLEGIIAGTILVAAAWAGLVAIDFSAGVLGTPLGAFVLAALTGYAGSAILDRLADKVFAPLKSS